MSFGITTGRYAVGVGVLQDDANALVHRAPDAGINFLDTANVYTEGQSEETLKTLDIAWQNVVIATKAEHAVGPGPNKRVPSKAYA